MRVGILGPVEVAVGDRTVAVDAAKERALLSVLALRAGRSVSPETLVDALWGDEPPTTAARTLRSHVSRLRQLVGAEVLQGEGAGYRLVLAAEEVDALQLETLVDRARDALARGRPGDASHAATAALALWRGDPLRDLADGGLRDGERARLEELRLMAMEQWIVAELQLGHHERMVGEIEALVALHPLREPLWGHLLVALYRSGRQTDALRAAERLRLLLRDQLGVDPSPATVRLERLILRQDPQLELVPPLPPDNLPTPENSFVGRADELRTLIADLHDHRLVTLVGPGGVGKTRLAVEASRRSIAAFGDGVWWVDLAPVRDPLTIASRVATTLGITQTGDASGEATLAAAVRHREMLLVVDNCEHLVGPTADLVHTLLGAAPALTVLATSRVPLAIPGEHRFRVHPMPLPDAGDADPTAYDAVRLFVERAGQVTGGAALDELDHVAEICRRLDGIPLAIELAAARTTVLEPSELVARLDRQLPVITRAHDLHDPRYDSLRTALEWSHQLLGPDEQALLAVLSVFPASFDLAAAEAVAGAPGSGVGDVVDALSGLVDASLVEVLAADTGRRFRMLESVRAYAGDQLGDAERVEALRRHSAHFRGLARSLDRDIDGSRSAEALSRLARDDANFRLAVAWSIDHDDRVTALEFAPSLGAARYRQGDLTGCLDLLDTLLDGSEDAAPALRGLAALRMVWPALLTGDADRAQGALEHAIALAQVAEDTTLLGASLMAAGHALLLGTGDIETAIPFYEQALAVPEPDQHAGHRLDAELGRAQALALADRPDGVRDLLARIEPVLRERGDDARLAHLLLDRALLAWGNGDVNEILVCADEGCRRARAAGSTDWEQINLTALGTGHLELGHVNKAETALIRAARMALDDGNVMQLGIALQVLAALRADQGDHRVAARLLGAGSGLAPSWPMVQRRLARWINRVRDALGPDFDEELTRGRSLRPAQAVAIALGVNP